jgi:hypothetical protein
MIKALLLIFDPIAAWDGIFRARRTMVSIVLIYLLPMLLLVAVGEGYGLVHWGKWQGEISHLKRFPVREAVIIESAQLLLSVLVVFLGAKMIGSIGETFHDRRTYAQAFATVAYGLSPLYLFRLLDAFAGISPWVSWSIGIILSMAVLYHGIPRMMEPDPPHAFGLYLMSSLLLLMITGTLRFITAACLQGKFPKMQAVISDLAARLPF